ncbi:MULTISPECIES: aldehyde dehydrogenase family protein [Streptomyces]|nr:aldehyde dehydrogenase family protein [Streptomyces canarius]
MTVTMTTAGSRIAGSGRIPVENPAFGEVFADAPACTPDEVDAVVGAAASAWPAWRALSEDTRRGLLRDCGAALSAHAAEIAGLLTREQGKPLNEATAEVRLACDWFRHTAALTLGPPERAADDAGADVVVERVPRGVVAAVAPSNFPVILSVVKIAPALLAGNTVVLKPSPVCPLSTLRMGEVIGPCLPGGVLSVISGGADVGAALTGHRDVRMVSFTGSVGSGRRIARTAAASFTHVVLELGGNDACVVLPDTDLAAVAGQIFRRSMVNAGQFCAAIKRVYVSRRQQGQLVEALVAAAEALTIGDGSVPGTDLGPVVSREQRDHVSALVTQARQAGARVVTGGTPLDRPGYFYAPTVLTDLPAGTRLEADEQFGPVIPVIAYDDVSEAVARANATPFGLGGSVWGDETTACEVAALLDCGTTWVNTHGELRHDVPFGGTRSSGVGVEYGHWGLLEYTRLRVRHVERQRGSARARSCQP